MADDMRIAAILLAAGRSARMGANKLLLQLDGEPLVHRSASTALAAGLDPVIVVVGYEADAVAAALGGLPIQRVDNERFERGLSTSLSAGAAAVPAATDAAVVLLADMPFVDAPLVREVLACHARTGAPVVSARYGGVPAPPTLYARQVLPELQGGEGEGRGREVVRRYGDRALFVDRPAAALADVDAPGDLDRLRGRLAGLEEA